VVIWYAKTAVKFSNLILLGFFCYEDVGDMFLRNIAWISTDYTTVYRRRQYKAKSKWSARGKVDQLPVGTAVAFTLINVPCISYIWQYMSNPVNWNPVCSAFMHVYEPPAGMSLKQFYLIFHLCTSLYFPLYIYIYIRKLTNLFDRISIRVSARVRADKCPW
jgi:hypothetical protein